MRIPQRGGGQNAPKGSQKNCRRRKKSNRRLRLQNLEQRQLLAGDVMHNVNLPEDVNADGVVSSFDALMIINDLSERARNPNFVRGEEPQMFRDVTGDGNVTPLDALQVINRMSEDERARRRGGQGGNGNNNGPQNPDTQDPKPPAPISKEVRSIDGSGNNLENPELGSTGIELTRIVDPDYADGISQPSGEDLPSAREISNVVFDQNESILNDRNLSDIVWQWGQFIDHDITLTGEAHEGEEESFNIAVPQGDPEFDPQNTGTQEIALTRSGAAEGTGVDSVLQQTNQITAFIDGSMVYGSDDDTAASLRAFEGGRLATSENGLCQLMRSMASSKRGMFGPTNNTV